MASKKSEIIKALGGKSCDVCGEAFSEDDLSHVEQLDMGGVFGMRGQATTCSGCAVTVARNNVKLAQERVDRERERIAKERREQAWAQSQTRPNTRRYHEAYAEHEDEINEAMRMWNSTDFEVD